MDISPYIQLPDISEMSQRDVTCPKLSFHLSSDLAPCRLLHLSKWLLIRITWTSNLADMLDFTLSHV